MDRGDPPSARIVAEIRRRIGSGELRPGDRVPSAREITGEWGVAIATATKVLACLRREGLVRAVPGVGTVVEFHERSCVAHKQPDVEEFHERPGVAQRRPDVEEIHERPGVAHKGPSAEEIHERPGVAQRRPDAEEFHESPGVAHKRPDVEEIHERPGVARKGPGAVEEIHGGPRVAYRPGDDLTRDRVVAAAIVVADASGLGALSMHRVAVELNVTTMFLYRYVPGRDELVLLMADAVIGERALPADPPAGWHAALELLARAQWAAYREHAWLAQVRTGTLPNAMAQIDWSMRALQGLGLDPGTMALIAVTLAGHVRGAGLDLESETGEHDASAAGGWIRSQAEAIPMPSRRHKADTRFEFGLQRLLDGFETYISSGGVRPTP